MARPIRNNADYHSHKSGLRNDLEIKALRFKFGHEGYAVYNMMLEVLTDSEYFERSWTKFDIEMLQADFMTEKLEEIIQYCVEPLKVFVIENGKIWSYSHRNSFVALLSKRKRDKSGVSVSDNPHSIVKDSIVEESKVKHSKEEPNGSGVLQTPSEDLFLRFEKLDKTKEMVAGFIKANKPTFPEPYVMLWNFMAQKFKLPEVKKISDSRRRKFRVRIKEEPFDFLAIVTKAVTSDFVRKGKWFSFDWVIENDKNYLKVLEGNYDPAPKETQLHRSEAKRTFNEELMYLMGRYMEGDLNPAAVSHEFYLQLEDRKFVPANYFAKFEGDTPEDREVAAVRAFLEKNKENYKPKK